WAALIMSVLLVGSSIVTTMLIPAEASGIGGEANGRALAYLAHRDLGDVFGTIYDLATIATLWFAGASALAGLLNLVPQYLPRFGMAPDWARATRPLALIITLMAAVVTIVFRADVNSQGGAYATGVLMLMTSAALAVAIAHPERRRTYVPIFIVFAYTTVVNIIERPEGLQIALWFIIAIVGSSLVSRVMRSTELRIEGIEYDELAQELVEEAARRQSLRIIANRPNAGDHEEYAHKLDEALTSHHLPSDALILFLEVRPGDTSDFSNRLKVTGHDVGGFYVLRCTSPAIPNAIAGLLLDLRDRTGITPHAYFGWTEGNPFTYLMKFLAFGEGDTAPVCREVLRQAEHNPEIRPRIHVG
ncbi:MAG: amino acid transporter, partial [Vicinamibacterales bacterium]